MRHVVNAQELGMYVSIVRQTYRFPYQRGQSSLLSVPIIKMPSFHLPISYSPPNMPVDAGVCPKLIFPASLEMDRAKKSLDEGILLS
jgi:hypothetical protein